jgi:PilZ domain.
MERRSFKRLPAEAEVTIRPIVGGSVRQATSKNISGGGILFTAAVRYEPGQFLEIEVETSTHRAFTHVFPPLKARVQVVRVVSDKAPFEIAARFIKK